MEDSNTIEVKVKVLTGDVEQVKVKGSHESVRVWGSYKLKISLTDLLRAEKEGDEAVQDKIVAELGKKGLDIVNIDNFHRLLVCPLGESEELIRPVSCGEWHEAVEKFSRTEAADADVQADKIAKQTKRPGGKADVRYHTSNVYNLKRPDKSCLIRDGTTLKCEPAPSKWKNWKELDQHLEHMAFAQLRLFVYDNLDWETAAPLDKAMMAVQEELRTSENAKVVTQRQCRDLIIPKFRKEFQPDSSRAGSADIREFDHERPKRRIALIIGINDYANFNKLKNPVNDAIALKAALEDLPSPFEVTLLTDEPEKGEKRPVHVGKMRKSVDAFAEKIDEYTIAIFAFMGHGVFCAAFLYPAVLAVRVFPPSVCCALAGFSLD
jgi:hypothetical protein